MSLSKPLKLLILIFTLIPPVYMCLFFFFIFSSFMRQPTTGDDPIFSHFKLFFIIHGFVMLLMVALMVFYIAYLFRTEKVDQQKKVLWAIALFMGAPIAMPLFWYFYVWNEPNQAAGE